MEISAVYTSVTAFLILVFAYRVANLRRNLNIGVGDGGDKVFSVAVRVHANLVEYAPITLILLLVAENLGFSAIFLHLCGSLFVVSRVSHAYGFTRSLGGYSIFRLMGILGTWLVIALLSVANLYAVFFN